MRHGIEVGTQARDQAADAASEHLTPNQRLAVVAGHGGAEVKYLRVGRGVDDDVAFAGRD
ncbi:hypothetical protein D3C86_1461080 [compost metagenome]